MAMRAPLYACLISLLATTFFFANYDIIRHAEVDANNTPSSTQNINKRKQRKRGASHVDVKTVRRKDARTRDVVSGPKKQRSADSGQKSKRKNNHAAKAVESTHPYHNNAVFITHYHKTGYVLSRELMFLLHQIEHEVHRPDIQYEKRGTKFEVSGVDESGERFAFDGVGNWARSAFSTRKHDRKTECPSPVGRKEVVLPPTEGFTLRDGTIYVQESPDLYCNDEEVLNGLALSHEGGTKIIHFVRNPYEMVLSNYFYHSQEPTPGEFNLTLYILQFSSSN